MEVKGRRFEILAIFLVGSLVGCSTFPHAKTWPEPVQVAPDAAIAAGHPSVVVGDIYLAKAEVAYAAAICAQEQGESQCVDDFFAAAQWAWHDVDSHLRDSGLPQTRAWEIYHSSLNGLVVEGQRFLRLDPRRGLRVRDPLRGWVIVPVVHHGFPRNADEFATLVGVGDYATGQLNHVHCRPGLGVPVIAMNCTQAGTLFRREEQAFAATLLLRPASETLSGAEPTPVLELYDPVRTTHALPPHDRFSLAGDISAPIERVLRTTQRNYLQSFLQPGLVAPDQAGLFMLEPYQAGKIPVVLIHGLLSDRLTWANLVNEMMSRPEIVERFQIWAFEYPTGEPFLTSAALLRRQLQQVREHFDPMAMDRALEQIVLVGHSMGGLISKMQITDSENQLWEAIANRQFEQVLLQPNTAERLSEAFFFDPSPMVGRVVFIGTPHRGSDVARRAIGRIGSLLIDEPAQLQAAHTQLLQANPGVFSSEFKQRVPTSIDLLDPDSQLLQAVDSLPIASHVRLHTIYGEGRWMLGSHDSDGVVEVSSARHPCSSSELAVDEKHARLTQHADVIQEVLDILYQHSNTHQFRTED
jgi:triacylglycerol esterase/lipase EstA (alpha/beta hydrolase family)